MREDSTWNRLSAEQQEAVEYWLFEERVSYKTLAARLKELCGIEVSETTVHRIYQMRARNRQRLGMLSAQSAARELEGMPVGTNDMCSATIRAVGATAMQVAREHPERVRELVSLAWVLLEHENMELRRRRQVHVEGNRYYGDTLSEPQRRLALVWNNPNLSDEEKLAQLEVTLSGGIPTGGGLKGGHG